MTTNDQLLWLPARLDHLAELDRRAHDDLNKLYDDLVDDADFSTNRFRRHLDDLARNLDQTARGVLKERANPEIIYLGED